jgi:hypothetical protein
MPLIFHRRSNPALAPGATGLAFAYSGSTLDEAGNAMTPDGYYWYASLNPEDPQDQGFGPYDAGASISGTWNGGFTPGVSYYRWVRGYKDYSGVKALSQLTAMGAAVAT